MSLQHFPPKVRERYMPASLSRLSTVVLDEPKLISLRCASAWIARAIAVFVFCVLGSSNTQAASAVQTIYFACTVAGVTAGFSADLCPNATSGAPVTVSTATPGVCSTTSGGHVVGLGVGTCTLVADAPIFQDVKMVIYGAARTTFSIPVSQIGQNIYWNCVVSGVTAGFSVSVCPQAVAASAGFGTNPSTLYPSAVTVTTTTPAACATTADGHVTGISAGTCTLVANAPGNLTFSAAPQVTKDIAVNPGAQTAQTIGFSGAPVLVVSATGLVVATGGASGNPVTFSSKTLDICTVLGNVVTGVSAGTCTIAADQAGNTAYSAAAQVIQTVLVGAKPSVVLNLLPSWNLVGNSVNAALDVAATLGDASKVSTVWKWMPASSKWAFYTPALADGGAAYAGTKGYEFLTVINGGEGFWVNAKSNFTLPLPAGTAISSVGFKDQPDPTQNKLLKTWNLIATGDSVTPSVFNRGISVTPPAQGVTPQNVTTLWAWDSALTNWYFYAPSLEASGGLQYYITSRGYLDFVAKPLDPAMGFWVNRP